MSVAKWEAELKRLETEKAQIIEASTAHRLEANRQATLQAHAALAEARRDENDRVSAAPLPAEIAELRDDNKTLMSQIRGLEERATNGVGAFGEKYVRPDAIEFFSRQFDEARGIEKGLLAQVSRINASPTATAGGRLVQSLAEAEAIVAEWPKVERLCKIGEQIFALQEKIRANNARVEQLHNDRREAALAVA
jgi:hypothetical protein